MMDGATIWMEYSSLYSTLIVVYGAMSKIGLLRIFLLHFNLFGYFASSNPSYQNRFVAMHAWVQFRNQNGRFIQGSKNQVEKHVILFNRLIIRILKMYGLLYVRCLVTELWAKM